MQLLIPKLIFFSPNVYSSQCFFPQYLIASIKTPLFLLNAAYDSWQVTTPFYRKQHHAMHRAMNWATREDFNIIYLFINQIQASLAPPAADPQGYWHECTLNHGKCTSSQIQFLQGELCFGLMSGSNKICIHCGPTNHAYLFLHISNRVQESNAECNKRFLSV